MARNRAREMVQGELGKKANVQKVYFGILGNASGDVIVPNRPGYVYVTLSDGMVTQAYNTLVPEVANLPVICGYDPRQMDSNLLRVLDVRNLPRYNENAKKYRVMNHHAAHEYMNPDGGVDVVYVQLRQLMPCAPHRLRVSRCRLIGTCRGSTGYGLSLVA